jgi:hypothetical protein
MKCVPSMKFKVTSYSLFISVVAFYLIPILFFSIYSIGLMSPNKSWNILTAGLLLCVGGAVLFLILIRKWELFFTKKALQSTLQDTIPSLDIHPVSHPSLEEESQSLESLQQDLKRTQEDLETKSYELAQAQEEQELFEKQATKSIQDLADYKIFSEEQLNQKSLLIHNLQQRFIELQGDLEAKTDKISQFESKIRDLSYEIKTLLQLNESEIKEADKSSKIERFSQSEGFLVKEPRHQYHYHADEENSPVVEMKVHDADEAMLMLKRCIDIAQKLAGANYHSSEGGRFREMSPQNYAIDLRRLFDSLRSENASMVLVYSQKEDRLLFVNNQSRSVLGWSSEKFIQDFQSIIQKGTVEWKHALIQAASHYEAQAKILMKTKTGNDIPVHCLLGMIPIGLFKGYIIGVLYPAK